MKVYTPKPSDSIPILWDDKPKQGTRTGHGNSNYNVCGFLAVGKKRASHLLKNQAAISAKLGTPWHYPYFATIKVLQQLTVKQHKDLWTHLVKALGNLGIVAAWAREITTKNLIDYHLVVREAPEDLMRNRGRKLRDIIRKTTTVKLNQQYKPLPSYKDAKEVINYCSKLQFSDTRTVKTDDVDVVVKHKPSDDIYKTKRVLFRKMPKGQNLQRFKHFGDFWEQKTSESDKQYKAKKQAKKARRINHPEVREAAKQLATLTAATNDTANEVDSIERDLHKACEKADPAELQTLIADNLQLAVHFHGGQLAYEEFIGGEREHDKREEERVKKLRQPRKKPKPKVDFVWTPDRLESFNPHEQDETKADAHAVGFSARNPDGCGEGTA